MLSIGLGIHAINRGYKVHFMTMNDLMNKSKANKAVNLLLKSESIIVMLMIVTFIIGAITSSGFMDFKYIIASLTQYIELAIVAVAFTFLLISGLLDLSVAAGMTLVTCVTALLHTMGIPMGWCALLGLMLGLVLGFINGALVAFTGIESMIITIGTTSLFRGLSQIIVSRGAITGIPDWFTGIDKIKVFNFLPLSFLIYIILVIIMEIILKKTFFGRKVYGMGTMKDIALYSGTSNKKHTVQLYVMVGGFVGLAGLMQLSRFQMAQYAMAMNGEMDVITMVLLGGTAFSGGRGSIIGTFLAFFVVAFIKIAMTLANVQRMVQLLIIGVLLILAVLLSDKVTDYNRKNLR